MGEVIGIIRRSVTRIAVERMTCIHTLPHVLIERKKIGAHFSDAPIEKISFGR
jgi:hypothetical protein